MAFKSHIFLYYDLFSNISHPTQPPTALTSHNHIPTLHHNTLYKLKPSAIKNTDAPSITKTTGKIKLVFSQLLRHNLFKFVINF